MKCVLWIFSDVEKIWRRIVFGGVISLDEEKTRTSVNNGAT